MKSISYGIMKSKEDYIKKYMNQKYSKISSQEGNLICISVENSKSDDIYFSELFLANVSGESYSSLSSEYMDEIVITCDYDYDEMLG